MYWLNPGVIYKVASLFQFPSDWVLLITGLAIKSQFKFIDRLRPLTPWGVIKVDTQLQLTLSSNHVVTTLHSLLLNQLLHRRVGGKGMTLPPTLANYSLDEESSKLHCTFRELSHYPQKGLTVPESPVCTCTYIRENNIINNISIKKLRFFLQCLVQRKLLLKLKSTWNDDQIYTLS